MLGIRKLLFWAVLLTAGYYGLDYVKVHTSGDVIAYKRFAKALMENDHYSARQASDEELAAKALSRHDARKKPFAGMRVLFTYYDVVRQNLARDGNSSTLVVDQVSRVGSRGQTGFWGDREVRVRHTAQLEKKNHVWKVTEFIDPSIR